MIGRIEEEVPTLERVEHDQLAMQLATRLFGGVSLKVAQILFGESEPPQTSEQFMPGKPDSQ